MQVWHQTCTYWLLWKTSQQEAYTFCRNQIIPWLSGSTAVWHTHAAQHNIACVTRSHALMIAEGKVAAAMSLRATTVLLLQVWPIYQVVVMQVGHALAVTLPAPCFIIDDNTPHWCVSVGNTATLTCLLDTCMVSQMHHTSTISMSNT